MKVVFIDLSEPVKIWVLVFGNAYSISISVVVTLHILGFEPFSGAFSVIMFFSRSMLIHSRRFASPERMAVSLRTRRNAAFFFGKFEEHIIWSSSSCREPARQVESFQKSTTLA